MSKGLGQDGLKRRVIVFTSAKGGVGKTTLSCITADKLADMGYRVLLVDTDAQGNSTDFAGVIPFLGEGAPEEGQYKEAIHDVILSQIQKLFQQPPAVTTQQAIYKARNFHVLPCDHRSERLKYWPQENAHKFETGIQLYKLWKEEFPTLLNSALAEVAENYDFIIIDTPPELGWATENALRVNLQGFAETNAIIPIELGNFEIMGLDQVNNFIIQGAKKNPKLALLGIIISRFGPRKANIDRDLEEEIREDPLWGEYIFETIVTRNLLVREATLSKESVFKYRRTNMKRSLLTNLNQFADELIDRLHRRDNLDRAAEI